MRIRQSAAADASAIHAVHTAAFRAHSPAVTGEMPEAKLVTELTAGGDLLPALSFVSLRDGEVIGQACSSSGRLDDDPDSAIGFGPLGILPDHHRRVIQAYRYHPWHSRPLAQSVVVGWFGLTQPDRERPGSARPRHAHPVGECSSNPGRVAVVQDASRQPSPGARSRRRAG